MFPGLFFHCIRLPFTFSYFFLISFTSAIIFLVISCSWSLSPSLSWLPLCFLSWLDWNRGHLSLSCLYSWLVEGLGFHCLLSSLGTSFRSSWCSWWHLYWVFIWMRELALSAHPAVPVSVMPAYFPVFGGSRLFLHFVSIPSRCLWYNSTDYLSCSLSVLSVTFDLEFSSTAFFDGCYLDFVFCLDGCFFYFFIALSLHIFCFCVSAFPFFL